MLSILSKNSISAVDVQKTLSVGKDHLVKNKNFIHQATANAHGFENFETIIAMLNREKMIRERLWIEQSSVNKRDFLIYAGNLMIVIYQNEFEIYNLEDKKVSYFELTMTMKSVLKDEVLTPDLFSFDYKNKTINFKSERDARLSFSIKRYENKLYFKVNNESAGVKCQYEIEIPELNNEFANTMFCESQHSRMLAEYCMASDFDLTVFNSELNISKQDINDTIDTAYWLFEKDKGNDDEAEEIEPKNKKYKYIAPLAHIAFKKAMQGDVYKNISESMNLEDSSDIYLYEELRNILKNEYDLFMLTHTLK